jgi:hypothetical protein
MSALFKPPGSDGLVEPLSTNDLIAAANSGRSRQPTYSSGLSSSSDSSKPGAVGDTRLTPTDGAGTTPAKLVPPSGSHTMPGSGRDLFLTTYSKPEVDPFEAAAMRTRQAVKRDGGRQNGPRAAPGAEAAAPRDRTSVPFQDRGEQASVALNPPAAKGQSSVNSLSQSAGQVRPTLWPTHVSEVPFGEPRKTGPAARPTVHFEGTGAPPSEAEAARAAAAFRQRSSLFHNDEGAATDSIPDLAMELGSMALPFAPSIAAQMAPRFAQRLLPRLLLPEYNGTTSGVLFTNEGRVVLFFPRVSNCALCPQQMLLPLESWLKPTWFRMWATATFRSRLVPRGRLKWTNHAICAGGGGFDENPGYEQ